MQSPVDQLLSLYKSVMEEEDDREGNQHNNQGNRQAGSQLFAAVNNLPRQLNGGGQQMTGEKRCYGEADTSADTARATSL